MFDPDQNRVRHGVHFPDDQENPKEMSMRTVRKEVLTHQQRQRGQKLLGRRDTDTSVETEQAEEDDRPVSEYPLTPIPIHTNSLKAIPGEPFEFHDFDKVYYPHLVNDGTTLVLIFNGTPELRPRIKNGGLGYPEYMVDTISFRWDSCHSMNYERFPLECHVQLIGTKFDVLEAAADKRAVAVLVTLFQYSSKQNESLEMIIPAVSAVAKRHKLPTFPPDGVKINQLLPELQTWYTRYDGTLMSRPYFKCQYTIFPTKIPVTRHQMALLTDIYDENQQPLVYNRVPLIERDHFPIVYRIKKS